MASRLCVKMASYCYVMLTKIEFHNCGETACKNGGELEPGNGVEVTWENGGSCGTFDGVTYSTKTCMLCDVTSIDDTQLEDDACPICIFTFSCSCCMSKFVYVVSFAAPKPMCATHLFQQHSISVSFIV